MYIRPVSPAAEFTEGVSRTHDSDDDDEDALRQLLLKSMAKKKSKQVVKVKQNEWFLQRLKASVLFL